MKERNINYFDTPEFRKQHGEIVVAILTKAQNDYYKRKVEKESKKK